MIRLSGFLRTCLLALPLALVLVSGAATARELTAAERASLAQTVANFDKAMRANDFNAVIDGSLSPRLLDTMAKSAGVKVGELRGAVISASQAALSVVKLQSFGMELGGAKYLELPSGAPYVLIPTQTTMEAGGNKIQQTSETLALMDEGKWYLLRISDPQQIQLLVLVYPEFSNVSFGSGTSKVAPQ